MRKLLKIILFSAAAILTIAFAIGWFIHREIERMHAYDLRDSLFCCVSKIRTLRYTHPAPTTAEIGDAIKNLDKNSVTTLWHDTDGNIVDPWGTPFFFTFDATKPNSRITATSAGPDRKLGTPDDVSYTESKYP